MTEERSSTRRLTTDHLSDESRVLGRELLRQHGRVSGLKNTVLLPARELK
jgi:hypothetical protein